MTRITIYVGMSSSSGSTQSYEIDAPDGWDQMTDREQDDAMAEEVQGAIDNYVQAGWHES